MVKAKNLEDFSDIYTITYYYCKKFIFISFTTYISY